MTPATSIVAPPYHVQSTAKDLRSGFPYFSHHDSISKLWAEKWRMPCQHGIYPFTDAKVDDFDPVFAELVKTSGDSSSILYRPDDYAKPFLPVAEPQGSPHFQMAPKVSAKTGSPASMAANRSTSGSSRCSGMVGMSS